jgi:hypothetical protein
MRQRQCRRQADSLQIAFLDLASDWTPPNPVFGQGGKPFDPSWKDYCPNAQTLTALSALPWAVRQEW